MRKSWFKMKKQAFHVNYEYAVTEVADDTSTLNNTLSAPLQLRNIKLFHHCCNTCHSFQGNSIDGAITIFDHKFAYDNMKSLYTADTRATDPINKYLLRLRRGP